MSNDEKRNILESNLARQLGWIAAADSKISFVFAIDTAMLGLLAVISPTSVCAWSTAPAIFATLATILILGSLLLLSFASFPRTEGPKNSLIYFGGIVKKSSEQFSNTILNLNTNDYIVDLTLQIHRNAEIAYCKTKWVQRALISMYASLIPWVLAIYLLYKGLSF